MKVFQYSDKEKSYLKNKDKKLAEVIEKLGHIEREIETDLYESLVRHVIGQQISVVAQETIWNRFVERLGEVTPSNLIQLSVEEIQSLGITFKKTEYILGITTSIVSGDFVIEDLYNMDDEEVVKTLSSFKGIGEWTAEMIMLFCMQRPNVLSYGDLAILRGMRMVYHHRKIDKQLFMKYKRRLSPYGSVASLYFWAVAAGKIPEMKDYKKKK